MWCWRLRQKIEAENKINCFVLYWDIYSFSSLSIKNHKSLINPQINHFYYLFYFPLTPSSYIPLHILAHIIFYSKIQPPAKQWLITPTNTNNHHSRLPIQSQDSTTKVIPVTPAPISIPTIITKIPPALIKIKIISVWISVRNSWSLKIKCRWGWAKIPTKIPIITVSRWGIEVEAKIVGDPNLHRFLLTDMLGCRLTRPESRQVWAEIIIRVGVKIIAYIRVIRVSRKRKRCSVIIKN